MSLFGGQWHRAALPQKQIMRASEETVFCSIVSMPGVKQQEIKIIRSIHAFFFFSVLEKQMCPYWFSTSWRLLGISQQVTESEKGRERKRELDVLSGTFGSVPGHSTHPFIEIPLCDPPIKWAIQISPSSSPRQKKKRRRKKKHPVSSSFNSFPTVCFFPDVLATFFYSYNLTETQKHGSRWG